jgi:hypothetical protein
LMVLALAGDSTMTKERVMSSVRIPQEVHQGIVRNPS